MKKIFFIFTLFLLNGFIFAQSNEVLDILYSEENAQTDATALLVLQASGVLSDDSVISDATDYLAGMEWGNSVLNDSDYITAGSFSLLVMKSYDLPHGIMYNFFPNRRYALKELVYQGYILGSPYLTDIMSSFDVISVLSSLPSPESINSNYVDEDPIVVEETAVVDSAEEPSPVEEVTVEVEEVEEVETAEEPVVDEATEVEAVEVEAVEVDVTEEVTSEVIIEETTPEETTVTEGSAVGE